MVEIGIRIKVVIKVKEYEILNGKVKVEEGTTSLYQDSIGDRNLDY